MENKVIELFYIFFQGALTFQVLIFGFLYIGTRRKDLLYYCLFLFFAAVYFFINAPYTFFGIPEDEVWNTAWYENTNIPVIILENLFYLLFLKSFFEDISADKTIAGLFRIVLYSIPSLIVLFILFRILQMNSQSIFYTVKLISIVPAIAVAYVILKKRIPFAKLVANGLLCTILGTCITVCMIALGNNGVSGLFTNSYPLFFIRLGVLGDMIFYLAAILKKWHFQEKQLVVEKLQSQLAVEKLRNKISSELHDDIGSTLSGISMYSYMINDLLQSGKYEEAKISAEIIQKTADDMTHNLGDLVWTINPKRNTLIKLIQRLEEYANDMGAAKNMSIKVVIPAFLEEYSLPMDTRRNIYLFCKEAINNAVKYSHGTLLELAIKKIDGILEFAVSDNGKGFDAETVKRGNGLYNMQKRADEIGAKLTVRSNQDKGSMLSMQLNIN